MHGRILSTLPLLLILGLGAARGQTAPTPPPPDDTGGNGPPAPAAGATSTAAPANKNPIVLDSFVVNGRLDLARDDIAPALGASQFQINVQQITLQPLGADASFNQVLLRAPGVAQDSYGQVHLRGEHGNLQYRLNDVLLPEGIDGFGQDLDTRFVESVNLLTGTLPAQYGYRTAGVVDIRTKSGGFANGGTVSLSTGSFGTFEPSFEIGGSAGNVSAYFTGSSLSGDNGIENPAASYAPLHDHTHQLKGFGYVSAVLSPVSRLSVLLSASAADFQIPDNPGQTPAYTLAHAPAGADDSAKLDENQHETNNYVIAAYEAATGPASLQLAVFARDSRTHFLPDQAGDLIFNGVASDVDRRIAGGGFEADGRWDAAPGHTLRAGLMLTDDSASTATATAVFPVDASGNQSSATPFTIADNSGQRGRLAGVYAQDEWKAASRLTLNYGLRADLSDAYLREGQLSPRLNAVWQLTHATSVHLGYARYFTPPPLELLQGRDIALFNGTTNASTTTTSSPARAERSHYFDAGLTHQFSEAFSVNLDSYIKFARQQLDEGQFGNALIYSPFNYATGRTEGVELSGNYTRDGFSAYANFAVSRATGRQITSGEFQFDPAELAYIATHEVYLDHDQRYTASAGASYRWRATRFYADLLYGSGLRHGFANTGKMPAYSPLSLGVEHTFKFARRRELRLRFDVANLFDEVYELRDGSGIGVGAPQYGARRGFYGGATWVF